MAGNPIIAPLNVVRLFINAGNPNNKTMHIRAIVDGEYVVYRVWSETKQNYAYALTDVLLFEGYIEEGWLTLVGKDTE